MAPRSEFNDTKNTQFHDRDLYISCYNMADGEAPFPFPRSVQEVHADSLWHFNHSPSGQQHHERMLVDRIASAITVLLLSMSPAFAVENVLVRHIDTLLDFVGFVTAHCVQHYDEGLKPEAVAKLHFSETDIATYCVCSTKLLVSEMDEKDFKTLEAGKVGNVLISFAPALKRIRYSCAKKVWDAKRKR